MLHTSFVTQIQRYVAKSGLSAAKPGFSVAKPGFSVAKPGFSVAKPGFSVASCDTIPGKLCLALPYLLRCIESCYSNLDIDLDSKHWECVVSVNNINIRPSALNAAMQPC